MSKRRGGAGGGKKNQVLFNKPEEPNFLKRMKAEIGYKEPEEEIDAKRQPIDNEESDDDTEKYDEKPQVVVLRNGDLTEEEASKLAKEEAEKPADLTQRIVFKSKKKKTTDEMLPEDNPNKVDDSKIEKSSKKSSDKHKSKSKAPAKNLLSFEDEVDDD
ncbi:unnamed protein product [Diamesa serratosioi]